MHACTSVQERYLPFGYVTEQTFYGNFDYVLIINASPGCNDEPGTKNVILN